MRSQVRMWSLLIAGVVSLGLAVLGACSTVVSVNPDGGSPGVPVCLTDVQTQNGTACSAPEGYQCLVGFSCPEPPDQQASCLCNSGKWACSYTAGDGGSIAVGATPTCIPYGDGMQAACPTDESPGMKCTVAGLVCTYAGETCPDSGSPNVDTCQCVSAGDAGAVDAGQGGAPPVVPHLVYACDRMLCNPESDATVPPPPDAEPPDAKPDVMMDAGSDTKA
jgi:hypothetical protein